MDIGKNKGSGDDSIACGEWVILPGSRAAVASGAEEVKGYLCHADGSITPHTFGLGKLTDDERKIILAGSLTGRAVEEKSEK